MHWSTFRFLVNWYGFFNIANSSSITFGPPNPENEFSALVHTLLRACMKMYWDKTQKDLKYSCHILLNTQYSFFVAVLFDRVAELNCCSLCSGEPSYTSLTIPRCICVRVCVYLCVCMSDTSAHGPEGFYSVRSQTTLWEMWYADRTCLWTEADNRRSKVFVCVWERPRES